MDKKGILNLLKSPDFKLQVGTLKSLPFHKTLNHLFAALCNEDEEIRWHAVTAAGELVGDLAGRDPEAARNILRRMIWSLNDESGGIGWGLPETMGEIMARNETLASEFAPILVSYLRPDGNFLEFEPLQQGVLWGLGRLAEVYPHSISPPDTVPFLLPFLESGDPRVRGNTLRVLGLLGNEEILPRLKNLLGEKTEIKRYQEGACRSFSLGQLAREAMESIRKRRDRPQERPGERV